MIVDNWALTPTTFVAVQNKTGRLKMQRVICVIAGVGKANNGKAKKTFAHHPRLHFPFRAIAIFNHPSKTIPFGEVCMYV